MSEAGITLLVEGEGAAGAGEELVRLVAGFEGGAAARVLAIEEAPDEVRRVIDPVAPAAVVVALPAAVLAVVDIVERIEKRRRAARLVAEGQAAEGGKKGAGVRPDGGRQPAAARGAVGGRAAGSRGGAARACRGRLSA